MGLLTPQGPEGIATETQQQQRRLNVPMLSDITLNYYSGPILFLVYINDLPGAIKGLIKIFADDAKVYYEIESIDTPQFMQDDLKEQTCG